MEECKGSGFIHRGQIKGFTRERRGAVPGSRIESGYVTSEMQRSKEKIRSRGGAGIPSGGGGRGGVMDGSLLILHSKWASSMSFMFLIFSSCCWSG